MTRPMGRFGLAAAVLGLALGVRGAQAAPVLDTADFSGQINPGNANVKAPFTGTLSQSGPIGGNFVFDSSLVPAAGSGFVNVPLPTTDGVSNIPAATAFDINLGGGLEFNLSNATFPVLIQYNNGHFNGFVYQADFAFGGNNYELDVQGTSLSVHLLTGGLPATQSLVNGTIFNGDANLTGIQPFTPAVPEPSTLLTSSMVGLMGLGYAWRRKAKAV